MGGPPCSIGAAEKPVFEASPLVAFMGAQVNICVAGFEHGRRVRLEMTSPTGATRTWSLHEAGSEWYVPFEPMPGAPLGRYRLLARQGTQQVEGSLVLRLSDVPFLRLSGDARPPHALIVAGVPANRPVLVHVYRAWGGEARRSLARKYYASFEVPTSRIGVGSIELRSLGGSTVTCYMFELDRAKTNSNAQLCLGDR